MPGGWWCVCSGSSFMAAGFMAGTPALKLVGVAARVLQALLVLQLKQWIAQLGAHPRGLSISTAEAQTARSRHKAGLSASQLQA